MLQDCNQNRFSRMKPVSGNSVQRRPQPSHQRLSGGIPINIVFGFLVSADQFRTLQESTPAVSQSSVQNEDRLIDPRSTRLSRLQAARRADDQETSRNEGIFNTVPIFSDEQGIVNSGDCVEPVSYGLNPTFFSHSLSACPPNILESQSGGNVNYELETGVKDDALYYGDVYDVACIIESCNKRISTAGQEWSAGRPGNRPIGARNATRNSDMCLGPYATCSAVQPHTGHNTHEHEASSRLPCREDQSTSQPTASSSRRSTAAEDRASTATVALHPRRPPYCARTQDEDVHVWTSIVSR